MTIDHSMTYSMYVEELPLLKKVYIAAQSFQKKGKKKENNYNTFLIIMELMNLITSWTPLNIGGRDP